MQQLEANSWARQMKAYLDAGEVSPAVAKNILSVSFEYIFLNIEFEIFTKRIFSALI